MPALHAGDQLLFTRDQLGQLLTILEKQGYQVIGSTVRDGAIVYDTVTSPDDFPIGYTDEQEGDK